MAEPAPSASTHDAPPAPAPLLIAAKSVWDPPIRREHAFATLAAAAGHQVIFSERPADVRRLLRASERGRYLRRLQHPALLPTAVPGVRRLAHSVMVPGQRSSLAAATANGPWRAALAGVTSEATCAVANVPWEWPAIAALAVARRVFDVADDFQAQVPDGRRRLTRYYARIAAEADAIIVANPELADQFPGRRVTVVPNGVFPQHIGDRDPVREQRTMIYVGTLTERFDAELVAATLTRLPQWRLELVGGCLYVGYGDRPAPELARLLALDDRVRWHGQLPRARALAIADRASVALIPNRPAESRGQDSMKLYDYAARGLPVVASFLPGDGVNLPPGTVQTADPAAFAAAVVAAAEQPAGLAAARREWAADNAWDRRWPDWCRAVFG